MAVPGPTGRRRYVLLLLILTTVVLISLDSRRDDDGVVGALGSVANEVVGPVRRLTNAIVSPIGRWVDGVTSAGSLEDENRDLREQLAEAEARLLRAEDAIEENQRLSELLELDFVEGIDRITARVISPPPGNYEDTVVLGRGESAGIREGMPVVSAGGLFGRVLEVSRTQSKVLVITDPRFSVSVRSARDRFAGIATGQAEPLLALEFVESVVRDATLVAGDAVVTSGLDGSRFPGGIPVGTVSEAFEDPSTSQQRGEIDPVVTVGEVEIVHVLDWDPTRDPQPEGAPEPQPESAADSTEAESGVAPTTSEP